MTSSSLPTENQHGASDEDGTDVATTVQAALQPLGFECHRLLVGWYNQLVSLPFRLPYPADTLALVVISTPDWFERCFLPYLRAGGSQRDPVDSCVRSVVSAAVRRLPVPARLWLDSDMVSGRPCVLLQTAGHLAGAVRMYRPAEGSRWAGACLHPRYGGWFALRAMVVVETLQAPALPRTEPPTVLTSEDQEAQLLDLFNNHWRDWRYRDLPHPPPPRCRYSPAQMLYFGSPSDQRPALLRRWLDGGESATRPDSAELATCSNGRESAIGSDSVESAVVPDSAESAIFADGARSTVVPDGGEAAVVRGGGKSGAGDGLTGDNGLGIVDQGIR